MALQQPFLSSPSVHAINQTSVTLGPTTVTVTRCGGTSPVMLCSFGGFVLNFNDVQIQIGMVPGTTLSILPLRSVIITEWKDR